MQSEVEHARKRRQAQEAARNGAHAPFTVVVFWPSKAMVFGKGLNEGTLEFGADFLSLQKATLNTRCGLKRSPSVLHCGGVLAIRRAGFGQEACARVSGAVHRVSCFHVLRVTPWVRGRRQVAEPLIRLGAQHEALVVASRKVLSSP